MIGFFVIKQYERAVVFHLGVATSGRRFWLAGVLAV